MFRWSVLFWLASVAALIWCGMNLIQLVVSGSYHPMSAKGDLLHTLRLMAIVGVVMTMFAVLILQSRHGSLVSRVYKIGIVVLVVLAALPVLPRIDSGFTQTAYLNDQRHEIPWQYSPSFGGETKGSRNFLIRVALPDMAQEYRLLSQTVTVGKAVDINNGRGGDAQSETCVTERRITRCEWQRGDFIYMMSGDTELFPEDLAALMPNVADLLDSFEVAAP